VVTSLLVFEGEGVVRDFVGGYSDWKNYRDQRDAAAQPPKPAPTAMPASRPANRGARLSYQAQRELNELPGRLQSLEAEKADIESRLADSSLYRGDAEELQTQLQRLGDITAELEAGYARWATLEALAPAGR
jgi:ATP-binding cassette subfamily F protein uup